MWRGDCGEEELAAVGSRARVRHAEKTRDIVFQVKVFILEFLAVNAFAASAIVIREITA